MNSEATAARTWQLVALAMVATTLLWPTSSAAIAVQIDSVVGRTSSFSPNKRLIGQTGKADDDTEATRRAINIADCQAYLKADKPEITVTWSWTDLPSILAPIDARWTVKLAPPGETCNVEELEKIDPESKCILLTYTSKFNLSAKGQQVHVDVRNLIGDTKCDAGSEQQAKLYFLIRYKTVDASGFEGATSTEDTAMTVDIDLQAPDPPKITSVNPGGTTLKVAWEHQVNSSTLTSRVYWSSVKFDQSTVTHAAKSAAANGTSFAVPNLTNGKVYYIGVTALDAHDNESAGSNVETGTPIEVQDLWQYYKANGGVSEGGYYGCSADAAGSSRGPLALLVLVLMALLGLRARRSAAGVLLATLVATSALIGGSAQAASPQTASIDARLGLYEPGIDSEFGKTSGATPYADVMGDGAWAKSFNIDWRVFHGFGELGAGMGFGWWSQDGKSKSLDGTAVDDANKLMIVPVTLDLVYRFDVLAKHWNFPLIPYGRVGMVYAFWWSYDGTDEVSVYRDAKGKPHTGEGGVAGVHWTGGVRLLLDVFEPQAAKSFDIELGVNHSYLFAEYQRMSINNFGDSKALDLSDDVIWFGLAFDL